ncbi:unnamed protein product, partial [Clavelina lepadiformis]
SIHKTLVNILRPVRNFCNTLTNILRPVRTFCNTLINILRPVRTFCNTIINILRPVRTFCNTLINILRPVRTFCNTIINILRPVRTFCNTLINILRPVRTFCNTLINILRPVRTFCNHFAPYSSQGTLYDRFHKALYRTDFTRHFIGPIAFQPVGRYALVRLKKIAVRMTNAGFSALVDIKTKKRNCLHDETLDDLMRGALEQEVVPNWSEIARNIQQQPIHKALYKTDFTRHFIGPISQGTFWDLILHHIVHKALYRTDFTRHFIGPIILHHIVHKALYRTDFTRHFIGPIF